MDKWKDKEGYDVTVEKMYQALPPNCVCVCEHRKYEHRHYKGNHTCIKCECEEFKPK